MMRPGIVLDVAELFKASTSIVSSTKSVFASVFI